MFEPKAGIGVRNRIDTGGATQSCSYTNVVLCMRTNVSVDNLTRSTQQPFALDA